MSLIILLIPSALIALVWFAFTYYQAQSPSYGRTFYRHTFLPRINPAEFTVILLIDLVLTAGMWFIFKDVETWDSENLNGRIVEKQARVAVSCSHCHSECTARDEDGNCTNTRHWCDHSEDYNWYLLTDFAEYFSEGRIEVARVDSQGVNEPPAWTAAYIGQPATVIHGYKNLLRGTGSESVLGFNPDSTLAQGARDMGLVPPRFQHIFQGWGNTPRMVILGAVAGWDGLAPLPRGSEAMFTSAAYNTLLMDANADAGPKVQANIQIIICVSICADNYADALMDAWRGGAKNDVNVFIRVDANWKPEWAAVRYGLPGEDQSEEVGQGNNAYLAQVLAGRILQEVVDVRDADFVVSMVKAEVMANFNRKPNKDFAHLEPGIHPTPMQMFTMAIFSIIFTGIACAYFHTHDPFGMD